MMSPLRNFNPWKGVKERLIGVSPNSSTGDDAVSTAAPRCKAPVLSERTCKLFTALFCATGVALIVIATLQFLPDAPTHVGREGNWTLAHGRDRLALAGLTLAYAALAIAGFWRLTLWQRRYGHFRSANGVADPAFEGHDRPVATRHNAVALPASLALLLFLLISFWARGLITSVDPPWPSLSMSLLLLPVGAWFLAQFWTQTRHWSELTLAFGSTMELVSTKIATTKGSDELRWPSPTVIGGPPQSPYSLQFRERDLETLCPPTEDQQWESDTRSLRSGKWPFAEGISPEPEGISAQFERTRFLKWQARLVAEMRYASVAVRSAAWCGILAPTAVLIGLNVYPPYDQRLQTTIAVAMIITGFLLIMYQALRLERDPLLSRMFTLHGDRLSLGGAFGALWPKLIAASVILIPVLFPEVSASLFNMIRSVNLLQ